MLTIVFTLFCPQLLRALLCKPRLMAASLQRSSLSEAWLSLLATQDSTLMANDHWYARRTVSGMAWLAHAKVSELVLHCIVGDDSLLKRDGEALLSLLLCSTTQKMETQKRKASIAIRNALNFIVLRRLHLFLFSVCVCVCVTMKKVPDEWQARQATPAILQVSSSKHNAKKITTRESGPFHQSITAILTEEKREEKQFTKPTHVAVCLFWDLNRDRSRL